MYSYTPNSQIGMDWMGNYPEFKEYYVCCNPNVVVYNHPWVDTSHAGLDVWYMY